MKKLLKWIIIIIIIGAALLSSIIALYLFRNTMTLTSEQKQTIEETISKPIPELVTGKTGFADNNGVSIWYESMMPEDSVRGSILLLMGNGIDALYWPTYFYEPLVDSGYHVIRIDNRDTGLSDWMKSTDKYTTDDMAQDAIAVLDALEIKHAHLFGASMGGMIAQHIAINNPERVITLTSLMSSGWIEDPELIGMPLSVMKEFIKLGLRYGIIPSETNMSKLQIASRYLLMGDVKTDPDVKMITEQVVYNMRKRNGYNSKAPQQQAAAISATGSRYKGLSQLQSPTLLIHGNSDPMIDFGHAIKCDELIPNSELLLIAGMGHDYTPMINETVLRRFFSFLNKNSSSLKD